MHAYCTPMNNQVHTKKKKNKPRRITERDKKVLYTRKCSTNLRDFKTNTIGTYVSASYAAIILFPIVKSNSKKKNKIISFVETKLTLQKNTSYTFL